MCWKYLILFFTRTNSELYMVDADHSSWRLIDFNWKNNAPSQKKKRCSFENNFARLKITRYFMFTCRWNHTQTKRILFYKTFQDKIHAYFRFTLNIYRPEMSYLDSKRITEMLFILHNDHVRFVFIGLFV